MTRVDFYLLNDAAAGKPLLACRLADKAYRLGHRSYILANDAGEAQTLDELLWTFAAGSFVPHGLYPAKAAVENPAVLIGHGPPPEDSHELLINLGPPAADFFNRFERVAEIVGASEPEKAAARERFRFYREHGCTLETHSI
jgi:DNA polymerase-3 subunit chi